MPNDSVRQALLAKKAEIEAALRELDRIEALAGLRDQNSPAASGKSISQSVLDAIAKHEKSVQQLATELGLSEGQVVNALTSHRLRHIVKSRKLNGKKVYGVIEELSSTDKGLSRKPLTDAIVDLLQRHPEHVFGISEVVDRLPKRIDSKSKDFPGTVASTLASLAKSERIKRVASGEYQAL